MEKHANAVRREPGSMRNKATMVAADADDGPAAAVKGIGSGTLRRGAGVAACADDGPAVADEDLAGDVPLENATSRDAAAF